jgi:hypothetical protein
MAFNVTVMFKDNTENSLNVFLVKTNGVCVHFKNLYLVFNQTASGNDSMQ